MTRYLSIDPIQEPFDLGLDDVGRFRMAFNIETVGEFTTIFTDEIADRLVSEGVGVRGTDIFIGSKAVIPPGDGPFASIIETGGALAMRTQNEVAPPAYPRNSAQISARGNSYDDVRTMIYNAYLALIIRNVDIGSAPSVVIPGVTVGDGRLVRSVFGTTTDATPTELFQDGATSRLVIAADTTTSFVATVIGRRTDGGAEEAFHIRLQGTISNDGGVVALDGPVSRSNIWRDDTTWTATATADDTNNALVFTVTGAAGKTVDWHIDVVFVRVAE